MSNITFNGKKTNLVKKTTLGNISPGSLGSDAAIVSQVVLKDSSATQTVTSVVAFTGANTHTGIETHSGAETHSGVETGFRRDVSIDSASATIAVAVAQSNAVFIAKKGSATQTYTLPAATTSGLKYTFICGHASGEILINPQTGEKFAFMTWAAIGADADTAQISQTTTGIKNTAATNVLGDAITLISDGVDTWFAEGMPTGIWATQ